MTIGARQENEAGNGEQRNEGFTHGIYSVISGSNVQSDSVTNTTSKLSSSMIQRRAMSSCGVGCEQRAVPRTPAIMTGIVIGYNRIGNSTSRLRARTSMAANSVPTRAKPTVPSSSSADQQQRVLEERRLKQQAPPAAR